jgi:hypothetical protein
MRTTLAGAMSTVDPGLSLADMIRKRKQVHAISYAGANLENIFLIWSRTPLVELDTRG